MVIGLNPFGTHLPMLMGCVVKAGGPVLEMGCGYYSTPMLHYLCSAMGLDLTSADTSLEWLARFQSLSRDWHSFVHVEDWAKCSLFDGRWGVVLMDHGNARRRPRDTRRLAGKADMIVCHDSDNTKMEYDEVLSEFKYRFDFKLFRPWTTVVSNHHDLEWLRK